MKTSFLSILFLTAVISSAFAQVANELQTALEQAGAKVRVDDTGNVIAIDARNTEITGETLRNLPMMKDLKLMGPQVTDATVAGLGGFQSLTSLALDRTSVTDATLIDEIAKLPKLQQLFLAETAVTDAGVAALAKNAGFTRLRLAGTDITDESLKVIAGMPKLQSLDLSSTTSITSVGVAQLTACKALTDLNFYNADLVDGSATAALAEMTWLEKLNLDNIVVSDDDAAKLAPLAENLTFLHLGGTKITDAAVPTLVKFTKLTTLHVNRTKVTEAGVEELKKALPGCEVITVGGEDKPVK